MIERGQPVVNRDKSHESSYKFRENSENEQIGIQYIDDAQTLFSLNDAHSCRNIKCQRVSCVCDQSVEYHVP